MYLLHRNPSEYCMDGLNSFVLTKEGEEWIYILSNLYLIYDQHVIPMNINTSEWKSPLTEAGTTQSGKMNLVFRSRSLQVLKVAEIWE